MIPQGFLKELPLPLQRGLKCSFIPSIHLLTRDSGQSGTFQDPNWILWNHSLTRVFLKGGWGPPVVAGSHPKKGNNWQKLFTLPVYTSAPPPKKNSFSLYVVFSNPLAPPQYKKPCHLCPFFSRENPSKLCQADFSLWIIQFTEIA